MGWSYNMPFPCPSCKEPTISDDSGVKETVMIGTDNIPGGIEIRHGAGMINPDESPKRYYSKTDLKKALNKSGLTIAGDTPVPYRV